jgi:hypothetical protein
MSLRPFPVDPESYTEHISLMTQRWVKLCVQRGADERHAREVATRALESAARGWQHYREEK